MTNRGTNKKRIDALLKNAKIASTREVKRAGEGKPPSATKGPKRALRTIAAVADSPGGKKAPPAPAATPDVGACTISIEGLGPVSCLDGITKARCQGVAASVGGTAKWVKNGKCP